MILRSVVTSLFFSASASAPTARLEVAAAKAGCKLSQNSTETLVCVFDKIYTAYHDLVFDSEIASLGSAATYGEITPDGAAAALGELARLSGAPLGPDDAFFDLGSGAGRLVLQAFLTAGVRYAGGLEIGSKRHQWASRAREQLLNLGLGGAGGEHGSALEFVQGDMIKTGEFWSKGTVLYVSTLAFDVPLVIRLGWALADHLRPGTVVLALKDFTGCYPRLMPVGRFQAMMTWNADRGNDVWMFMVMPALARPQPQWLPAQSRVDGLEARLLGTHSVSDTLSAEEWSAACRREWPDMDVVSTARFARLTAETLGVRYPKDGVPGELARALPTALVNGTSAKDAVQCASDAISARAKLFDDGPYGSGQRRRMDPKKARLLPKGALPGVEEPDADDEAIHLPHIIARLEDLSARDRHGRLLEQVLATARREKVATATITALFPRLREKFPADDVGGGAMMGAYHQGHVEVARVLIDGGLNPNIVMDNTAKRALHFAALYGHLPVAKLLLAKGADVHALDAKGFKPGNLVKNSAPDELRQLLPMAREDL